jgi:hypothetical protein
MGSHTRSKESLKGGRVGFVLSEVAFREGEDRLHADFNELFDALQPFGYHITLFYACGLDRRGWGWGNALFAKKADKPFGWLSTSPFCKPVIAGLT